MAPLPEHGRNANLIADVVKVLLDYLGREYEAFTPITMELPEESGMEPDYCFYIDNWAAVAGKKRINWSIDPPPLSLREPLRGASASLKSALGQSLP